MSVFSIFIDQLGTEAVPLIVEDSTQLTEKGSLKGRDDASSDSGTSMCVNELLRSRGTREHILILFRRQKPRFFGLQIGCPSKFLQGLWASFLCPLGTKRG